MIKNGGKATMKEMLKELLNLSTETEIVEFKEAKTQYSIDKLGKYFSALSNEANLKSAEHAFLVFGVRDDRSIVGTNIGDKQINNYKAEIAGNTTSGLTFIEVHRIIENNKQVLIFQIPPAPKGMPISWKGHYYGRNGNSLSALNIQEIERIRIQVSTKDWSAQIIENASEFDLSDEALEMARRLFVIKNPQLKKEIESWDKITFLNKAKLAIKGKITNTAILLLGKSEVEHFISPAVAKITWVLRDKDNIEKDYEHFSCPFLLSVDKIYAKIRNLRYRYLQKGSLFPEEVEQYDPYIIREALNNCIAHQDYSLGGKINIIEKEDSTLTFINMGNFIPETIENVVISDAPESKYRNPFLANAMVNLNMIDTIGSGIKRMFVIQKDKFFPLPEYSFINDSVKVVINGKVMDLKYAEKLAQMPDLSLYEIILLDKVQKQKQLSDTEVGELKRQKLIEGRKPNFYISAVVAKETDQKEEYIKMRGIEGDYIQKMILDYLKEFGEAKKKDFEGLLLDKLSDLLDVRQKKNKIKNNLQILRKNGIIEIQGKIWRIFPEK